MGTPCYLVSCSSGQFSWEPLCYILEPAFRSYFHSAEYIALEVCKEVACGPRLPF